MAKAKAKSGGENLVEKKPKPAKAPAKVASPKITIGKYFQYHGEGIHPYQLAFVADRFRGIIKTKEEWDEEVAEYTEGNK